MRIRLSTFAALLLGCQATGSITPEFDGQKALAYAKTQLDFGPRIPGTEGHRKMGLWLDSLLRTKADTAYSQDWVHVTVDKDSLPMRNFIARFNPRATKRLLFLAHWDTRPHANHDAERPNDPVPGANDGASGVAVLLAVADVLRNKPPAVGVDLLFVDGEDYGEFDGDELDVLIGAKYYAAHQAPGPMPEYAILLDMVGGANARFRKEGHSLVAAPDVVEKVWTMAQRVGAGKYFVDESWGGDVTDDHVPLSEAGFKAIDIIADFGSGSTFPYHHTTQDTFDKLSPEVLGAVGNVVTALIRQAK